MKKKKCKKVECPAGEKWAVPYADFLSLLLALFIALYALASVNKAKMEALKAAFVKIYAFRPITDQVNPIVKKDNTGEAKQRSSNGMLSGAKSVLNSGAQAVFTASQSDMSSMLIKTKQLMTNSNKMVKKHQGGSDIFIKHSERGFIINLPASLLFQKNSAKITNEDAILLLKRIVSIVKKMPKNVEILVNGYTDNLPPTKQSGYQDNWQLSSARAISVVKELIADGVKGERLAAVGHADHQAIAPNDTAAGRSKNRRVTISFIAQHMPGSASQKENILNKK